MSAAVNNKIILHADDSAILAADKQTSKFKKTSEG